MKSFAAFSGLVLGAVLLVIGYAMAALRAEVTYPAPLWLACGALVLLPVLYWMKAARKLRQGASRFAFAAMIAGLAIVAVPLAGSPDQRASNGPAFIIFSAVWLVAALPLLRAGIRYRP